MLLKTADALRTSGKQKRESLSQKKKKRKRSTCRKKSLYGMAGFVCPPDECFFFFFEEERGCRNWEGRRGKRGNELKKKKGWS